MTRGEFQDRYSYNNRKHRIGGGSFGTVYKAYDRTLDKEVAIKVQEVDYINNKEFSLQIEYDAIKSLADHPNIANYESVFRFEEGPGLYDYAIMQFYSLGNLSDYLKKNKINNNQKDKILVQILQGIAYLHYNKVVHRDIKSGNILVVERPSEGIIPKITDFGLSKLAEIDNAHSAFKNSFAGGTVEYSSPEQLKGSNIKFNTDLWSFGIIIFEVFTGKTLFDVEGYGEGTAGKQGEIIQQIFKKDIENELDLLPEKWQFIAKLCLKRNQDERPSTGRELLKHLPTSLYDENKDVFLKEKLRKKTETVKIDDQQDDRTVTEVFSSFKNEDDKTTIFESKKNEGLDIINSTKIEEPLKAPKSRFIKNKLWLVGLLTAVVISVILIGFTKFSNVSIDADYVAMVVVNGKTEYINSKGKPIIESNFLAGSSFSEGLAPVQTSEGWNFIDISGNIVIQENYDLAISFSDGFALVQKNDQWFFINKKGENIFEKTFTDANVFSEGFAPVKNGPKVIFIDKAGDKVFENEFEAAFSFSNGLAPVQNREKWGFIDKRGELVIDYKYLATKDFAEGFVAVKKDNKWIFIDKNGKQSFDGNFDSTRNFSEGLSAVKLNNRWGFIDNKGKIIIDFKYDSAGDFVNGMAPVKIKNEWIFIDENNSKVIDFQYEMVDNFSKVN